MSLAEKNAAQAEKVIAGVGPYIDTLATLAEQIKMKDTPGLLREQRVLLDKDTFWLIVLGRFRNGKSTFLNALLCELTHPVPELGDAGPLPVKDLPCTATLTTIDYATTPGVTVVKTDGRTEEWSLARFRTEGTIRRNPEENKRFFDGITKFQVHFPSRTLQSGITLLDSPGTDDIRERTEIVEAAVHRCDAAIVLLRSDVMAGEDEREFIQGVRACGLTDVFFVINRRDGRVVDADLKEEAWNRVVALALGGHLYKDQDLSAERIYFVDAKAALEGRLRGGAKAVVESGLETFERRLSDYLERERRPAHIRRFVQAADAHARAIDEGIQKLIPTIKAKAEEFRAKYKQMEPELKDIHRAKDRLPKIIERYRDKAESALETSFRQMINDLCRDLPTELAKAKIPSVDDSNFLQKFALPLYQKTIAKETAAAARSIYEARLSAWGDNVPPKPGVQLVLSRVIEELSQEITDEIRQIKRRFDRIQFELTGFQPDVTSEEEAAEGWVKRVLYGAAALISPDYAMNLMVGGFAGLFKGFLVHMTVGGLVYLLGGPVGWAFLAGAAANAIFQALTAPDQLKGKFRQKVCDGLIPKLRELPDKVRPDMVGKLKAAFVKIKSGITEAVGVEIAREEQTLRDQLDLTLKSAEEKQKVLAGLEHCRSEVARCSEGLKNTLIAVEAGRL